MLSKPSNFKSTTLLWSSINHFVNNGSTSLVFTVESSIAFSFAEISYFTLLSLKFLSKLLWEVSSVFLHAIVLGFDSFSPKKV